MSVLFTHSPLASSRGSLSSGLSGPSTATGYQPTPLMQSTIAEGDNKLAKLLDNDNDDESFEVPDFHFDWGVQKEKTNPDDKTSGSLDRHRPLSATPILSDFGDSSRSHRTPSEHTLSPASHHFPSTSTSLSSVHAPSPRSLQASSNNPLPRPVSSSNGDNRLHTAPGYTVDDVAIGSGSSSHINRAYGGRTFQRVVSAPVTRHRGEIGIESGPGSQVRSGPPHTSSTSSVADYAANRKDCVTPGIANRTLSTATSTVTSTARRLGGLSRFGPARRVVAPQETDGIEEEQEGASPASIGSPSLRSPPEIAEYSSNNNRYMSSHQGRSSPPVVELDTKVSDMASSTIMADRGAHKTSPLTSSMDSADRDLRPDYQSWLDQENHMIPSMRQAKQPEPQHIQRQIAQPLHPAHTIISPVANPLLREPPQANRPAPVPNLQNQYHQSTEQRQPDTLPQGTGAPPQLIQNGKRSYIVNGNPYERVGVLGKGGTSKVYSVICPNKRIIYALKRVALDRADAETYQSYTNEIELLKRLRGHDRIIQLIDHQITFSQNNRPRVLMMVMECGEIDFAMLLDEQRGKAVNMNFVGLYWEQMLEAVYAVHQENVVHTDLKPANFVLVKGRLKIIDFGIAKAIANDTVNIQRDQQIGTVNYMSPEAIQRMNNQKVLKLSYPSDVWSLGCILYQMIYGSPPFAHISGPLPKMTAIANPATVISFPTESVPKAMIGPDGRPNDPSGRATKIGRHAIDTMRRCLAYRKEDRLTIPQLLKHEFLRPTFQDLENSTIITPAQMTMLVNFVMKANGLPPTKDTDDTAVDLFRQLQYQNTHH